MKSILDLFQAGGLVMYPLLGCSLLVWFVVFERAHSFWKLSEKNRAFHLEALNAMLRGDQANAIRGLCATHSELPSAKMLQVALERLTSNNSKIQSRWAEAFERQRLLENQSLRKNLWILGTIATASPFIGLFGTVVGILESFKAMAETGKGGFAVVAAGISEALIATAAGIILAVVAVFAYNTFQTRWSRLVLELKLQAQELLELIPSITKDGSHGN